MNGMFKQSQMRFSQIKSRALTAMVARYILLTNSETLRIPVVFMKFESNRIMDILKCYSNLKVTKMKPFWPKEMWANVGLPPTINVGTKHINFRNGSM